MSRTATLETEFCGQRLSTPGAPMSRGDGGTDLADRLPTPQAAEMSCYSTDQEIHVGLHGLPGGAEGNRTPDLCSAIAALSRLIQSFLRLSLIATLPVS